MRLPSVFVLAWLLLGKVMAAEQPYLEQSRRDYIASALQAFFEAGELEIANTQEYLDVAERNSCRASNSDLRTDCLLSYAARNCDAVANQRNAANCQFYSDVMVVNKLSQDAFITRSERYRILSSNSSDGRGAIEGRLQQKYARLVAHFSLTDAANCGNTDFSCLARSLDRFCLDYANTQSLSWQHCVGAAVWFMGTARQ